jgi:hypothetical protein
MELYFPDAVVIFKYYLWQEIKLPESNSIVAY